MDPAQIDSLLSRNPSWMDMAAPVPAYTPGDSTPKKSSVFPGNSATYGDQSQSGGGGASPTGSTKTVMHLVQDPDTLEWSLETITVLTT